MAIMTVTNDDDKYTEEYLAKRIQTLQDRIRKAVPTQDVLDPANSFTSVMQSLESSVVSLKASTTLLEALQKEQKEHSNAIDDTVIDQAKEAVSKAQDSVETLNDTATNLGCHIIKAHKLLELLKSCCGGIHRDILECAVLVQATPKALAEWCAQDVAKHHQLLDAFLGDHHQMKAMLMASGPVRGLYGPALVILDKLQGEMPNRGDYQSTNLLDRLALAIALEHAAHIPIFKTSDQYVDPIQRFWHFADAHQDGVLDDIFETLTVWELRMVVDCDATHEDMTWGREFLKAYRPDEIWTSDEQWRYNRVVKTDVGYRHPDHEFANYVDLLSAGGECGARAWFGRFMCKSWGVPTWGVRQPGHAAMTRYTTTKGWLICLGANVWEKCTWDDLRSGAKNNVQRHGNDFLEEAKARMAHGQACGLSYENVVMLECLAECFGETVEYGYTSEKFWRSLSIAKRKQMAQSVPDRKMSFGSQNGSTVVYHASAALGQTCETENVFVKLDGTVVIPAASYDAKSNFDKNVTTMDSFLGGKQIHFASNDGAAEYMLPSDIARGTYEMSLTIVNVHRDQKPMEVIVDDSCSGTLDDFELLPKPSQTMEIPYTAGRWQRTKDNIEVELSPGARLQLSRTGPCWGLTMKEIVLKRKEKN